MVMSMDKSSFSEIISGFYENVSSLHDLDEIRDCFLSYTSQLGYNQVAYGFSAFVTQNKFKMEEAIQTSNYDPEYMQRYMDRDYGSLDETIHNCFESGYKPWTWEHIDVIRKKVSEGIYSQEQLRASEDTWYSGIRTGITFPLESNKCSLLGVLGLHGTELGWREHINLSDHVRSVLHQLSYIMHAHVRKSIRLGNLKLENLLNIRKRELQHLQNLADGMTRKDSATSLGVKAKRMDAIHDGVMHKLDTQKKEHAIARAIVYGIVHVEPESGWSLDSEETDFVRYMALGYPAWKIAETMHFSERKAYNMRRRIKTKLDAVTAEQAVANAITMNQIDL